MNTAIFLNPEIHVKARIINEHDWQPFLSDLILPKKVVFIMQGTIFGSVKKVCWNFGDSTKIITITNRKQIPHETEITHIFREKHCQGISSLYVQASVYTEKEQVITTTNYLVEPKIKGAKNYVDPTVFKLQILTFYKTNILTDELAISVQQIATRLSYAPNFINYCVDEETEALTQRGWLNYKNITKEDIILSYDTETKGLKWSKIKDLYINTNYDGKMHYLTTKAFDALVTPDHKFISKQQGIISVEQIKCGEHLILMGTPVENQPGFHGYSSDFIELLGWAVTEGNYRIGVNMRDWYSIFWIFHTNEVTIFQKVGPYADRIRILLNTLDAHYKEYFWNKEKTMIGFRVSKEIANSITAIAPNRIISYEFINFLSQEQRMILIEAMINGGGTRRKDSTKDAPTPWSYIQKDKLHIDSFVYLCTLAGITTTTRLTKNYSKWSKDPYYTVHLYSKPKLYCKTDCINFHGGRPGPGGDCTKGKNGNPNVPMIDYKGIVWCPSTEYGTFVCRRNGKIYVTGNSYREEMVGDALIKMFEALREHKFDPDKGNPFSYFTKIAFHAFCNRIKKEKKMHQAHNDFQEMVFDSLVDNGVLPANRTNTSHNSDEDSYFFENTH